MIETERLMCENAALVALIRTCRKPDTWTSIANFCVLEGSAERVLRNRIDPRNNPLHMEEYDSRPVQGELLDDDCGVDSGYSRELVSEMDSAFDDLEQWKSEGLDFVSVFDPRFPERLRATIDVPPFLFADGALEPEDMGVSVVGSRRCTPEGAEFARECSEMLVGLGLTVIAGLASGIDTFAHRTALECGGRTVAFIGTGIRKCYPAENRSLQEEISERGLVLSQFWPDASPTKQSFPMRNALMSGYGMATIVADAGERSGTRIQARQAQRHGRPVIINRMVLDKAQWARDLAGKPGIYIVDDIQDVEKALRMVFGVENNVDDLIRKVMESETALA